MKKSSLKISNNPPIGENWREAWEGEASIRFLEILNSNFEKLGFQIHVQLIILENHNETSTFIRRNFLYKIFVRKE